MPAWPSGSTPRQQQAGRGDGKHGLRPATGPEDGADERAGEEHHRERLSNGLGTVVGIVRPEGALFSRPPNSLENGALA